MSDEPALLQATIAHADEDTPRLVFADWLDENGDPDRAEFIRVQCRLAEMPPNDPDSVELTERQDELLARLQHRNLAPWKKAPKRFYFNTTFIEGFNEHLRRGFPYSVDCQTSGREWTSAEVKRVIGDFTQLVRTTTVRGFDSYELPLGALKELLAALAPRELASLSVSPAAKMSEPEAAPAFYRLVANSPALSGLRELFLYSGNVGTPPEALRELAGATALDSVRRLTIQELTEPDGIGELTRAPWFGRLRNFRCRLEGAAAAPMVHGLGELPALHTANLNWLAPGGVAALAAGKFPALGRLVYGGALDVQSAKLLAGARFPALAVFEGCGRDYGGHGGLTDASLTELLKADWFAQLRAIALAGNAIGDKGLKALAAHPVAKSLRRLALGDNAFTMRAFAALAKKGAFPALVVLDLHLHRRCKSNSDDVAKFLSALQVPNLRYLNLERWPLGNAGAKALAANASLAGLRRLRLSSCRIGDPGAKAILASPHLQNLTELHLAANNIKAGADALADRAVMPRLGDCWLNVNKIPESSARKFRRPGLRLYV